MKKSNIYISAAVTAFIIIILIVLFINIYLKNINQIKIGLILPFTGAGKYTGDELLSGIKFAVNEANKWGGINNRKIKLIIRDSESNPDKAVGLFYEIEKEKPLFYMTSLSSISLKLATEAEKNKVVLCCLTTAAPEITQNKNYVYRYWPMAINEADSLFKILEKIKIKNLGILYLNDVFGNSVNDTVKNKNNNKYKIKSIPYALNENNFNDIIYKLLNSEAIYIVGYDSHFASIIKSIINNKYNGYIIGTNGVIISYLRGDFTLDTFFASCPLIYNANYQFSKKVKDSYYKTFKKDFNHFSANGYDMAAIVLDLIKDKKDINRAELERLFNNGFVHTGVFGTIVVHKNAHDFSFDFYPVKVEEGKIIYDW